MCTEYDGVDALNENITMGDLWLTGMAAGAKKSGRTVQYCMPYAYDLLHAAAEPAVTNARATGDYFHAADQWYVRTFTCDVPFFDLNMNIHAGKWTWMGIMAVLFLFLHTSFTTHALLSRSPFLCPYRPIGPLRPTSHSHVCPLEYTYIQYR